MDTEDEVSTILNETNADKEYQHFLDISPDSEKEIPNTANNSGGIYIYVSFVEFRYSNDYISNLDLRDTQQSYVPGVWGKRGGLPT